MILLIYLLSVYFSNKNFNTVFKKVLRKIPKDLIIRESELKLIKFISTVCPVLNTCVALGGLFLKEKTN